MPSRLHRFHNSGQTHFITFSCWHRHPYFADPATRPVFETALKRIRHAFLLRIYGYVVMPDHVHLLLSEPRRETLAVAIKSLKQGVSRRLICDELHFLQKRYYDFNVHDQEKFQEKLRYIHRNPVKKELCARPGDWQWSSFRHYATGHEGIVEIESDWTANKRERAAGRLCALTYSPTQAKDA